MTNDTQKRIDEYKALLPGIRERIIAVALMLAMSFAMIASASYAWLTISRAPEAKGMSTTVTGNGSLEIALVPADGSEPGNANGLATSLLESNITWGNLVNLSDSRYGLDKIVLRPATISGITPTKTPLQGATYGEDGRVLTTTDLYRFASWVEKGGTMVFSADDKDVGYGVRAITSVTYENLTGNAHIAVLQGQANQEYENARTLYVQLIENKTNVGSQNQDFVGSITALQALMQLYVQEQADKATGGSTTTDYSGRVTHAYNLIDAFLQVMWHEGEMLRYLANLQIYMSGDSTQDRDYDTLDDLVTAQNNGNLHPAVSLAGLKQFASDYAALAKVLKDDPNKTDDFYDLAQQCDPGKTGTKPTVAWTVIEPAVTVLVNINNATIAGKEISKLASASKSELLGIIMGGEQEVIIKAGALRNVEARIGAYLENKNVKMTVGVSAYGMGPFNVTAKVRTDVTTGILNTLGMQDYNNTLAMDNNSNSGDAVAKDTYGMAIDLWVRTNAPDVVLTLEGSLVTKEVVVTTYDKNGKETVVYVMSNTVTKETNVYRVTEGSVHTYYNAETHAVVGSSEELTALAGFTFQAAGTKVPNAAGEMVDLYVMSQTSTVQLDVYMIEGAKTWYDATNHTSLGTNETLTRENGYTFTHTGATGTNASGQRVDLYKMTYVDPTTKEKTETTVYMKSTTDDIWYYDGSHIEIGPDADVREGGATFVEKMEEVVTGYDGVNRVWEDFLSQIEAGTMLENNTTQGAGSCYVFYADPSDQTRILELLKAFTIVFVDQDGKEYGTAKLDTEHAFSINGKTTVPLVMITGTTYVDENGDEKVGITALERNEATRISAIVYLDGQYVTNEDVLAVGELEGMLNIQFGSSVTLQNMDDTDLRFETREISASAAYTFVNDKGETVVMNTDSSSSPIALEYDGKITKVDVTLTVTGEQPKSIRGFFVRSISTTQGTRGEMIDFVHQGGSIWTATFDLTRPGTYIMRNLIVDGADYGLYDGTDGENSMDNFPTIQIAGLSVSNVYCTLKEGITMTADNYVEALVSVSVNASADLMPKQVRALFRSNDGKEFTVLLANNGDDGHTSSWVGNARITDSGTYTLQYVVVDGDYYPTNQESAYIIYLGLTTRVTSTGIPTEDGGFSDSVEFRGEAKNIDVSVMIYDNTNQPLEGLEDVWLYYHSTASAFDEHGMYGQVVWNSDKKVYEGRLELKFAGTYVFNRVTVNRGSTNPSAISSTKSAPTFTAYVTDPPEYLGHSTDANQFTPNGGAVMKVIMTNAQTAALWAEIQDQNGNRYMVFCEKNELMNLQDNKYMFYFNIPTNNDGEFKGKQDGQWTLLALHMQGVAMPNADPNADPIWMPITVADPKNEVPEASACYILNMESENITSYVIHTIDVKIQDANGHVYTGETFGLAADGTVTGKFMQAFQTGAIQVIVQDWNDQPIDLITDVSWNRYYANGSAINYGGYSPGMDYPQEPAVSLTGSGTTYTLAGQTFQWAGTYTTTFTITAGDASTTITGPSFAVHSNAPTVVISGSSPYSTTVHMEYVEGETGGCNSEKTYAYNSPAVTLELAGLGVNVTSAKVTFAATAGGTVHLYSTANNSGTRTDYFNWTADGSAKLYVGLGYAAKTDKTSPTVAGELKATELKIEYNGVVFTVDITDIVINNPD